MIIYFISRWRLYPRFLSALMLFWFLNVCFCYSCCFKLYHYHTYCFWMSQLDSCNFCWFLCLQEPLFICIHWWCCILFFINISPSLYWLHVPGEIIGHVDHEPFYQRRDFFRPFILYLKRSNVVEPCLSNVLCVGFMIIRSCCSSTKVAYLKVSYQVIFLFFIFFVNSIFITNCIFFWFHF